MSLPCRSHPPLNLIETFWNQSSVLLCYAIPRQERAFYFRRVEFLPIDRFSWYLKTMTHAYLGLADSDGLKTFLPETDSLQRRFSQRVRDDGQHIAVWSVLDSDALAAIQQLLIAADYRTAWQYLQSHSAHLGRLI